MVREIKFRTWDTINKEFSEWTNRDPFFSTSHSRIFFWERTKKEDGSYGGDITIQDNENRFILSQFTGIKDSDGKEIYDGDFITFDPDVRFMGNCIWKNAGHIWIPNLIDGAQVSYNHPFSEQSDKMSNITLKYYTEIYKNGSPQLKMYVIGNYFENPNLIESL